MDSGVLILEAGLAALVAWKLRRNPPLGNEGKPEDSSARLVRFYLGFFAASTLALLAVRELGLPVRALMLLAWCATAVLLGLAGMLSARAGQPPWAAAWFSFAAAFCLALYAGKAPGISLLYSAVAATWLYYALTAGAAYLLEKDNRAAGRWALLGWIWMAQAAAPAMSLLAYQGLGIDAGRWVNMICATGVIVALTWFLGRLEVQPEGRALPLLPVRQEAQE